MSSLNNRVETFFQNNYAFIVLSALLVRIVLVIYGTIQDELLEVKYSDVDYAVVTDAARYVWEDGKSPYERTTYRYSPLLSYLLIPNITWHPSFGKFLFVSFDLLAAVLVQKLILISGLSKSHSMMGVILWLWNPLSLTISTRGSGDSIICTLVLATLLGLVTVRGVERKDEYNYRTLVILILSALAHGLSVHWRLYPIIFAPSILLFLRNWPHRILFGLISGGIFFFLGILFYLVYGRIFLQETFLYHLSRTDHRHNFSVWFYPLYLGMNNANVSRLLSLATFIPQVLAQLVILRKFASTDLTFCFFLQTWAFVVFNKVVTAQYFLWYVSLLPITLFSIKMPKAHVVLFLGVPWLVSELHWLLWAYRIEFLGLSSFEGVFVAGAIFFAVNVHILCSLIISHTLDGRVHSVEDNNKKES